MSPQAHVDAVLREGMELATIAERHPAATIPSYPGWSMLDLVAHTGSVQRRVAEIVRTRATVPVDRLAYEDRDEGAVLAWFREGLKGLVDALAGSDPGRPVWTFAADKTIGFWHRRMAHETAIHRWDAEDASGAPRPIASWLAAEAIPESLEVHVVDPLERQADGWSSEASLELRCREPVASWRLRLGATGVELDQAGGPADVVVSGSASDTWLYLMRRPNGCEIEGRRDVAEDFERALATIERPGY